MRVLVVVLVSIGVVVGLLPLIFAYLDQTALASEVEYNGVYEPLRGVEMSTEYSNYLGEAFDDRSGVQIQRWAIAMPFVGAAIGLITALALGRAGFRLNRR